MNPQSNRPRVAIACGGTGGHLFPGIAVGEELIARGHDVTLLVSPKEVDQEAVKSSREMDVVTLPAIGLTAGNPLNFLRAAWNSYRSARREFSARPPLAVLAMGGFTSAPAVFAGRSLGARTFFHESNSIPGKANRYLSHVVDEAFFYFPEAAQRTCARNTRISGMPVRMNFLEAPDASGARMALGLHADEPVLLVMGGSQGASGINELVAGGLQKLSHLWPNLQILHLTGVRDFEKIREIYARDFRGGSIVRPFLTEMDLALAAATVAVSRAGASSLAEIAAVRVPSILIPFPAATDNHQFFNGTRFSSQGGALCLEQKTLTSDELVRAIDSLLRDEPRRDGMRSALESWRSPEAAARIADRIIEWTAPLQRGAAKMETAPAISVSWRTSQ
jgi:UDP-N-acetylglucosamine--N-acetylmuramyl-(pentapeptide) pyrophosphoryl-undecaprenol N-acetylglucosamine transferase